MRACRPQGSWSLLQLTRLHSEGWKRHRTVMMIATTPGTFRGPNPSVKEPTVWAAVSCAQSQGRRQWPRRLPCRRAWKQNKDTVVMSVTSCAASVSASRRRGYTSRGLRHQPYAWWRSEHHGHPTVGVLGLRGSPGESRRWKSKCEEMRDTIESGYPAGATTTKTSH